MSPDRPSDLPSPAAYPVHCEVEVRFRDLDAMGHVNNAVYLSYLEVGRTEYIRRLGLGEGKPERLTELFPFILAEITCRFLSPAGLGERLAVHLRCPRVGRSSFDFDYLVTGLESGRRVASARSVQVCYDYSDGRTRPMPPSLREAIERLEGTLAPA